MQHLQAHENIAVHWLALNVMQSALNVTSVNWKYSDFRLQRLRIDK